VIGYEVRSARGRVSVVKSEASTVRQYLDELPAGRREVVAAVRETILRHLPSGYQETMNWGMINYVIPLKRYPNTYNREPLGYVALAAQKNHFSLYLMCVYQDSKQEAKLKRGFEASGKRLDMGKSCVRFRKLEDLPLDVIGEVIASTPPDEFIATYERSRRR
jgi:hypothetical protein